MWTKWDMLPLYVPITEALGNGVNVDGFMNPNINVSALTHSERIESSTLSNSVVPARVGFVGLGAMGAPMTENLLRAGHDVMVFDTRAEPMELLRSRRAQGRRVAQRGGGRV